MLPLRTARARAASRRPAPSLVSHTTLRRYSQQQQRQQPSPTVLQHPPHSSTGLFKLTPHATFQGAFYKAFTRPVAKCALLAVLVYQLAYFGWRKLEADEIGEERRGE